MKTRLAVPLLLVGVLLTAGCVQSGTNNTGINNSSSNTTTASAQGMAVFTITDAAPNMGAITSVNVTVSDVLVHSESDGWITVASPDKTYDLLVLKQTGTQALLADANLTNGAYDQIRLDISKVVVTDANGSHEAKLPSDEFRINTNFTVNGNTTSLVVFDFDANQSLHVTGGGRYIMAPVAKIRTEKGVEIDEHDHEDVKASGGENETETEVGMDENGHVGTNISIPHNANVTISTNGSISVNISGRKVHSGRY